MSGIGVNPEHVHGVPLSTVLEDFGDQWHEQFNEMVVTGEFGRFESHSVHLDRHIEVSVFSPHPDRVAALVVDITPRKKQERLLQDMRRELERRVEVRTFELVRANEQLRNEITQRIATQEELLNKTKELESSNAELEAFSYSASHDLRSPVRAIHGLVQILLEDYGDQIDDTGREYFQRVLSSTERMERLISDILEYSRLGTMEMQLQPVSLAAVIEEVCKLLSNELETRGAIIEMDPVMPAVLASRPVMIQIFINLISNSLKFTREGVAPMVRISADRVGPDVAVCFKDNGIGIPPQHYKRIFKVFERLHGPNIYPGTGIGLAIVNKGVQRMNGSIEISDIQDGGTCFTLNLAASPR